MSFLRHRTVRIAFCLFFAVLAIISGCGRKEATDLNRSKSEEILARVEEEIITIKDYKEEFAMLPPSYRGVANLHRSQFLESLVNKRLLLKEAKGKNLQNSENVKRLFQKVKEEIIIQEFIDSEINDKAELTNSEIEKYYRENQNNYMEPARIRASHILVDSELLAKKILTDLRQGADFVELAGEHSLDLPTKDKGGDLGYFAKGTLLPGFEQACEKLNIGEISEVVKTDLGYHIIKVLDKKEGKLKIFEVIKDEIKSELLRDKQAKLYDDLLQELRKNQNISINTQLLEKIELGQIK